MNTMTKDTKEKKEGNVAFLKVMVNAVSKLWSFMTKTLGIVFIAAFTLLILAIAMPDNVIKVIDIVRNLFMEVGIVGFG